MNICTYVHISVTGGAKPCWCGVQEPTKAYQGTKAPPLEAYISASIQRNFGGVRTLIVSQTFCRSSCPKSFFFFFGIGKFHLAATGVEGEGISNILLPLSWWCSFKPLRSVHMHCIIPIYYVFL